MENKLEAGGTKIDSKNSKWNMPKTNSVWTHSYVKFKSKQNTKLTDTENRLLVARGRGQGIDKMGKGEQTSNCKISYVDLIYNSATIANSTAL